MALAAFQGSVSALPPLFQTNSRDLLVQLVDPAVSGNFNQQFTVLDCSDSSLVIVISTGVTGQTGDEAERQLVLADDTDFTWDSELNAFTGSLDLDNDAVAGYLDNVSERSALLEISLVTSGKVTTCYQGAVTLKATSFVPAA